MGKIKEILHKNIDNEIYPARGKWEVLDWKNWAIFIIGALLIYLSDKIYQLFH